MKARAIIVGIRDRFTIKNTDGTEAMEIENKHSFIAALKRRMNLFVGAGFSTLADNTDGMRIPLGSELAAELRDKFSLSSITNLDLPRLCTLIEARDKDGLDAFLRKRFSIGKFHDCYNALHFLDLDTVFTTNIDNLIHKIFEGSKDRYLNDIDFHGPVFNDRQGVDIVMLHGSILVEGRPLRFSSKDIASSFGSDPDRWRNLRERIGRSPTLFAGYSFEDAATIETFSPHSTGNTKAEAWILVHPDNANEGTISYFQALKLQTIVGTTKDLLEFIAQECQDGASHAQISSRATRDLFPGAYIPQPSEVHARQIKEFFLGSPPSWFDIYSGILYKTTHFNAAKNAINSGTHTVLTGVPASGRTTLLMQLAATIEYSGHKLMISSPTVEQANLIVRKLENEPALVVIDNFTDEMSAVQVFLSNSNIQLLLSDRDYNLSNIAHLLPRGALKIIDVSNLSDQDMQGCRGTIPEFVRKREFVRPHVAEGHKPSLFEFIQANTLTPRLEVRLKEALSRLSRESPYAAEALLLVAYVHSCRTPVSLDMALSYWHDDGLDYKSVLSLLKNVGGIVTEYEGDLADEPQDYFAARSELFADAILKASAPESLAKLLSKFHRNVSPSRVCHYNLFKRNAYDARMFERAFPDFNEGKKLYDLVYERDPSPYTLQQEALYLSYRGQHLAAFSIIDRAIASTRATNWTIKNSHAIILFRANISFSTSIDARKTLDQSMEILSQCYRSDRRKIFHVLTFADHALKYWNAYRDKKAKEYLDQARIWLKDAYTDEPWRHQQVQRLLSMVEKQL